MLLFKVAKNTNRNTDAAVWSRAWLNGVTGISLYKSKIKELHTYIVLLYFEPNTKIACSTYKTGATAGLTDHYKLIFNRLGVAGAVLQTPSQFIDWFIH